MSKASSAPTIRLRGVRHNNLKNFDLDLPLHQMVVITGLSGSGKSSLAFDTLFAEGQRRYIETFSPYARQFFDRMDKPQVDSIEGIPPAIAIEQRNAVKSTRSTVGTMTEICDYMKILWPQLAQLHCRQCGRVVRKDSPQQIWQTFFGEGAAPGRTGDLLITFNLPVSEKLSLDESLALINKQGYQRLLLENEIVRLEEAAPRLRELKPGALTIIQDRINPANADRARFVEACEQAYHFGKGKLEIREAPSSQPSTPMGEKGSSIPHPDLSRQSRATAEHRTPHFFSRGLHCAHCDIEYSEPTPALFSFNHPVGACPACRGFGRVIGIDYNLVLPDHSKTLAGGVVKPWQTGQSAECQADLMKFCRIRKAPTDVPFQELSQKWKDWLMNGDPDYAQDEEHKWPHAWYGIKGYFRWLESKAYKMHVRVLLSRYRSYQLCPDCQGRRFQPESLLYKIPQVRSLGENCPNASSQIEPQNSPTPRSSPSPPEERRGRGLGRGGAQLPEVAGEATLADFYQLSIRDALRLIDWLAEKHNVKRNDPLGLALNEVRARLGYLSDVGLGYLTLDRPTRSLSGGETERVNLTTCLGTRLVNTLFVLDEPSVGLHPRDTGRLVRILEHLRDAGNTVVVVEHEASVMRAANQIVDIGPGHGSTGGEIVFQGTYPAILKSGNSLTGQYLSGQRRIPLPKRRPVGADKLEITHATLHNLQDLTVEIPLGRFVCLTGVSGSGKTTLARDILLPLLGSKFKVQGLKSNGTDDAEDSNEEDEDSAPGDVGATHNPPQLSNWASLGRVVLVDQSALGKTPRSNPAVYIGAFNDIRDFFANSDLARQQGLGPSAFSFNSTQGQCERCRGSGFEKIEMQFLSDIYIRCPECHGRRYRPHILEIKISAGPPVSRIPHPASQEWSIADLLDAPVDDAVAFLAAFPESRPARRALTSIKLLQEVGLGYLRLGQPINTLSGGESQRLKLVRHLAEFTQAGAADTKPALFLFDEPTTGLHFDDVRVLLEVFQRLVDAGHSVLIIEHNLDVIKSADWVIDLGPDAGDEGGQLVAQGTPEQVAECPRSHTGQALKEAL
jgi:excinuclease ABC subunit A